MKCSKQWLSRYVDLDGVSIPELADRFTLSVAELEGVEEVGAELDTVIVARIESCERHPNADKLQVCQVNDGSDTLRTIVCGAPNARPGLLVALALPGSKFGDFKIRTSKVRGVESAGMLCAMKELGLGEEEDGIWALSGDLTLGAPLHTYFPVRDSIFELDNKSITHRPDLWGHYGIAREIAGLLDRPLNPPSTDVTLGDDDPIDIQLHDAEACPRYCALSMDRVKVTSSPVWMQILLHRVGTRAINNIVDATNFVMLELGNPIHAFDADEVKGDTINIRRAHKGEQVITRDRQERALIDSDLLICDGERPVALAGVMGLENSEVRSETESLIIEAANFKSEVVRRTAVRLGLRTEASARFEKSLDPALPALAARRMAVLVKEMCPDARVTSALGDRWPHPPTALKIKTSTSYINRRLGTTLSADYIRGALSSVAFEVQDIDGDMMQVGVPSFRATKDISIPEDLVEEVGRLYGYDNITPIQPSVEIPTPYRHPERTLHRKIRTVLSFNGGCYETRNYSFDSEPLLDKIGRGPAPRLTLKNPISSEQVHLRPALLPNLIAAVERSTAHCDALAVYEIGRVFIVSQDAPEDSPQPFNLAMVNWRAPKSAHKINEAMGHQGGQDTAYAEIKGLCDLLCEALNASVTYERTDGAQPIWLHPARCARVMLNTKAGTTPIGYVGNLHPDVTESLGLGDHVSAAEWTLSPLVEAGLTYGSYSPIARHPSVLFDLSVIVPESVSHDDLKGLILKAHKRWVQEAQCTAVYRGAPIPEGQKSVTFQITFQDSTSTLEMDRVNKVIDKLTKRLKDELGGWVRV